MSVWTCKTRAHAHAHAHAHGVSEQATDGEHNNSLQHTLPIPTKLEKQATVDVLLAASNATDVHGRNGFGGGPKLQYDGFADAGCFLEKLVGNTGQLRHAVETLRLCCGEEFSGALKLHVPVPDGGVSGRCAATWLRRGGRRGGRRHRRRWHVSSSGLAVQRFVSRGFGHVVVVR